MAGQIQGGSGGSNTEQFEAYFRRADLDHDGRISGAEAVSFLQGSNLSKQVLAQIWMYADQSRTGYLSRAEFYNALKLVTVSQSKRELTPEMVKAALYGPASAKIPAPQINLAAIPSPSSNSVNVQPTFQGGVPSTTSQSPGLRGNPRSMTNVGLQPTFQGGVPTTNSQSPGLRGNPPPVMNVGPPVTNVGVQHTLQGGIPSTTSQNPGLRGNPPPINNMNQPYFPSQSAQSTRPPISTPMGVASQPRQDVRPSTFPGGGTLVGQSFPNSSPNLPVSGPAVGVSTGYPTQLNNRVASLSAHKPQDPTSAFSSTATSDLKAVPGPGNGIASDSMFGGDMFSAAQSTPKQTSLVPATQSAIVPTTSPTVSPAKPDPFAVLQSTYNRPSTDWQTQQTQSFPKPNQQLSTQATPAFSPPGISTSVGENSTPDQSQLWPKMTRPGVQKYEKVFKEVDTDRDGKITGKEAYDLFLSWRLPRVILKQVWDLSDQDNDSMLSLREFSIALYLMERYREGRTLPSTLPDSVMRDETLLSLAGPPSTYGSMGWGTSFGLRPQQVLPGSQPVIHGRPQQVLTGSQPVIHGRPPLPVSYLPDGSAVHELSNGIQSNLDSKDDRSESDSKVENRDKVIMDSKEKLEFYRTKMQDLVLYKSRCDNRLNEITERARADKREAELLAGKYEEKYKQVEEIASKLNIEEASFRDIQGRKMELQQAIIKVEQGGSADGLLQVRADRIQSNLDDLLKYLDEYSKKLNVQLKSTAVLELPPGWQSGIPEISAPWDEEWDKFKDEGFLHDVAIPVTAESASPPKEYSSPSHSISPDAISTADKSVKGFDRVGSTHETESSYAHSDGETNSLQGSPLKHSASESVFHDFMDDKNGKSFDMDAESHGGGFDDSTWGTFDNNDDVDSVWGFNPKDPDNEKHGDKYFFDSNDFGASPSRLDSPRNEDSFNKNSEYRFEDSTHGSPLSKASNSPKGFNSTTGDSYFDSFSRYDSFSVPDHSSPRRETLSRFDSMNSTASFDHSRGFSFDDSDPFGSTGPFKVSSDGQSKKKGSDSWSSL